MLSSTMSLRIQNIINFLFLSLFFITPLIYSSSNSELFEIPKMYFIYLTSALIFFFHIANYIQGKTTLYRPIQLNRYLFIFLGSQILATLFSIDKHVSFFGFYSRMNGGLLSLMVFCGLFLVLPNYLNNLFKQKLISTLLISGLIVSIYGILQHFGVDKTSWKQDVQSRVFSTLGQPNWLAAYLCILLPFSLNRFFSSSRLIHKSYFLLLTSSFWLCLLYTKSKSGIFAAVISLAVYVIARSIQATKQSRSGLLHSVRNDVYRLSFIVALFVSLSLTVSNPIKDIIFPNKISNSSLVISNLNVTPSEDIRKIVWHGAIDLWKQHPILGTGPETFAFSYYWTRPASHNLTSEWQFLYNKAHNEYINYLATSGIIGFLAYLILVVFTIYQLLITGYKNSLPYLVAYFSILITNISGFSVATTSLFFFLLPLLAINFPAIIPKPARPAGGSYFLNLKSKLLFTVFLIINFSLLTINCVKFYLADLAHTKSVYFDSRAAYDKAYQHATLSLKLRPNEPTYLVQSSDLEAKLAITTKENAYVSQSTNHITTANNISPYDVNLLKQRAQIYYYLSAIDKNYYLDTLNTLIHLTKLAPTDPTNYFLLGRFYQNISETDRAITNYQQAISLKANYDHATFALGELYYQQKKYTDSKPLLEQTLVIAPTNLQAKDYLARIATASATK